MEKKGVVLVGHSYIRRLGEFCISHQERLNLGLRTDRYTVTAVQVRGGRVGSRSLATSLRVPVVRTADVIFVHVGENDYRSSSSAESLALELYSTVAGHLVTLDNMTRIVIAELLPMPRHRQRWSEDVNRELRRLVARGDHRIRLWRFQATLRGREAFSSDGIHLRRDYLKTYWKAVRDAVVTGLVNQ